MQNEYFNEDRLSVKALLIILGSILNVLGSLFVQHFNIPLYFDSCFTFTIAALCGLMPAVIMAIFTNTFLALLGIVGFPFMICHILTAVGAWLIFNYRGQNLSCFLWAGLLSAITNGIIGSMISYLVFHGITTIGQIDNLILGVATACQSLGIAVFWGGIISNLVDKGLSALLGYFILVFIIKFYQKIKPSRLA